MNCTGERCIMQFDKVDPSTCKCVSYCPQATPPKTNADRIRSMSDEELAYYLNGLTGDGCPPLAKCKYPDEGHRYKCSVRKCWLNWLKEEVSE